MEIFYNTITQLGTRITSEQIVFYMDEKVDWLK